MNFVPQFLTRRLVQINYRHKDDTMSFVRIEIISKGNKKFSSEIETNNSYSINCSSGETIKFPDKICDVCISDGIMLVRTEDRDFRSGCQNVPFIKDNREKNNIDAFDWQGTHLWNIGDIVGDIKMAFDGITYITSEEAQLEFQVVAESSHELFRCIAGGFVFVIDATAHKLLCKVSGKAK